MGNAVSHMQLGNGEVARLMAAHDWQRSPLGDPATWPQALRTIVTLMLHSKFPMFLAWGPQLGFLYNDAYVEVLADKHPDALGRRFQDIWSEIWSDISPIIDLAMRGEATYYDNLPFKMMRKGYVEPTWFSFSYSPVFDDSGRVAGMFCACTETTRQVLAERDRISENERLRQLFRQAPGIMAVLRHSHHVFELANEAYFELVGSRDLIGKTVREALPELEGQGWFERLDQVYRSGEPYVGHGVAVKLRRQHDGGLEERFVDFIYQPIRDTTGRVNGIFVEGSDVTDAVLANRALHESEQRLRAMANTIPHLAWMADPDGSIHWYNDRWYEYTGTTYMSMRRIGWQRFPEPERLPEIIANWERSLATGEPFEMTYRLRSGSGEYRTFFTRAAPLRDRSDAIVQWFGTHTDIEKMEQVQEELRAANRRKDEFLAMLAHELRNPLAPISTSAELLKLANLDPERIRQTSGIIARQVAHMTELVDDLLDVSRVTRGLITLQCEPLDLREVVADAIEQVQSQIEAKSQSLNVRAPAKALRVNGDRTRLTQVFSNILNNANKYTPEYGHVTVEAAAEGDVARVTVSDDGIGMTANLLPYVFELFTQAERTPDRAQGGLGLGLALVKSLAELHGGSVAAASEGPGKGSQVSVRLPLLEPGPVAPAEAASRTTESDAARPLELLVVDDNVDAAQTLALLLQLHGHQVHVGHSAGDALRQVAARVFDVIILDIGLPDVDGFELASRLRALPNAAEACLIALTGYGHDEARSRSRAAGFSHHLVKPVSLPDLMAVLPKAGVGERGDFEAGGSQ